MSPPPEAPPLLPATDRPDPRLATVLGDGLQGHFVDQVGRSDARPLAIMVADPATGAPVGGLLGRTSLGLFFLDLFYLPARLRGGGLGSRILAAAEAEAVRRGCVAATLVTVNVQAPGFYAKHGWQEFGRVPCVPGIERIFFRKILEVSPCRTRSRSRSPSTSTRSRGSRAAPGTARAPSTTAAR